MSIVPGWSPKIVFCDVDGCITSEASAAFQESEMEGLMHLFRGPIRGNLPRFVLCTGRPQPYVECLLKLLDLHEPAICENGAVLYTLASNHARYAPGVTPERLRGLRRVRAFIEDKLLPAHPRALLQYGKEAQISVYSTVHEDLIEMAGDVMRFAEEAGGPALDINTSHYYLNISLDGVSKGSAIRHLLNEYGLSREDAAGIGDTEGDLAIREETRFFACPANARPALRKVADYTSPHAEAAGVLDILTQLVPPV